MIFGKSIKRLRKERGWTQAELAKYSGLAEDTIRRIEHGHDPNLATIAKLSTGLGYRLSTLFRVWEEGEELDTITLGLMDCLHGQSPERIALAVKVLRELFDYLDTHTHTSTKGKDKP